MSMHEGYRRHQAFEEAWRQIKRDPGLSASDFECAARYHHSPERLRDFSDYRGYVLWFVELYKSGQDLMAGLSAMVRQADCAGFSWYSPKRVLYRIRRDSGMFYAKLADFHADVAECQRCFMASGIHEKAGYVDSLSDLLHQLDTLDARITTTVSQKLNEIGTVRIALVSLAVAAVSLAISALFK